MKFTHKRFKALQEAADGKNYPCTDGIRRKLEENGLIWSRHRYSSGMHLGDINYPPWAITQKGTEQLKTWQEDNTTTTNAK